MKYIITVRNIDITKGIEDAIYEKLGKLEKFFTEETEAYVTLNVTKDRHKIEVTIPVKGSIIRSEQTSTDMYVSIDLVQEILERQLRKYRTKLMQHRQNTDFFANFTPIEDEDDDIDAIQIVRTKRFGIKPMHPEEACIQMELLGHNFYVFLNGNTDEVNVVYRRKNGTYGLIEPTFE